MKLTPTSITNPDGTYSPAIKSDDVVWVKTIGYETSEENATGIAKDRLRTINREIMILLVNGDYTPIKGL